MKITGVIIALIVIALSLLLAPPGSFYFSIPTTLSVVLWFVAMVVFIIILAKILSGKEEVTLI